MYPHFQQSYISPAPLFPVMTTFITLFPPLSLNRRMHKVDLRSRLTWKLSPSCASLQKLLGAAGAVRAFPYQIGHEDYIYTRLNQHHCLLGILTIISLLLQGCRSDGGLGVLRQRRGQPGSGGSEGNVFILNTGLPHWDKHCLPGKCINQHQMSQMQC